MEEQRKLRVTAGFDGYVDTIGRAVKEKAADGSLVFFETIEEFGKHIVSKAGKSALMELHTQDTRMGGCMALYSRALLALDVEVTLMGALGMPETHPVFRDVVNHPNAHVHSVGQPGYTEAVEFHDGKIMFGHNEEIAQLDAKQLARELEKQGTSSEELLKGADMIALFNWSELTHATGIWKSIAGELNAPVLVDLADLSMRTDEEIKEMFALLSLIARKVPVTLSVNKNELEQLCRGLGLPEGLHPVEAAGILFERLSGSRIVVHLTGGAFCVCRAGLFSRRNVHYEKPLISTGGGDNFNAGLTFGLLNDWHMNECLALANAVSGFYVSHGYSPSQQEVLELLKTGQYDLEMAEI